jgi:hypothetical protein
MLIVTGTTRGLTFGPVTRTFPEYLPGAAPLRFGVSVSTKLSLVGSEVTRATLTCTAERVIRAAESSRTKSPSREAPSLSAVGTGSEAMISTDTGWLL